MHPQKAMAVKSLPLSTYFVLMGDVYKTPQIETKVLIGCVRLCGTNQLDRKIQIAVLSTRLYGETHIDYLDIISSSSICNKNRILTKLWR